MSALLAGVSTLAFVVVGGLVGARLLLLARRTRALPELAVGLSLFLLSAVSYPATLLVISEQMPQAASRGLMFLASAASSTAWAAIFVFTWRTFRPGSRAGRVAGLAGAGLILALGVLSLRRVARAQDVAALLDFGLATFGIQMLAMGAYAWTAVEGFRYHVLMRRRRALGLADAVVANRFLLWGLTGVFALVVVGGSTLHTLAGGGYEATWLRLLTGVGGIGSSVSLYLAFLPPAAWRRWLLRGASAPA